MTLNPLVFLNTLVGRAQRRWPRLRALDDANWKTWCWHTLFTFLGGALLSLVPGVTLATGTFVLFVGYVFREIGQDAPDYTDLIGPALVVIWSIQ